MNPLRSLLVATAGAVGSVVALVASPGAYRWLRVRAGLDAESRALELEDFPPPPEPLPEGPDPRISLRARLHEERHEEPSTPGDERPAVVPDGGDDVRAAVEETRTRARAKAARPFAVAPDPSDGLDGDVDR